MADEFSIHLNLGEVIGATAEAKKTLEKRLQSAAKALATQTHAHVKEQAAARLNTRRDEFNDNLEFEQVDTNTWAIIVKQKARWIEDGMEPHSMLDDLLASPKAKRAKDGSKYIVIPFKHNKGPTQQSPRQRAIKDVLKEELKKHKIPYGKIERNPDGSVKTGLLHKHDFDRYQKKLGNNEHGPQSFPLSTYPLARGEGPEGRPFLHGVRVYQKLKRNPDGSPKLDKKGRQQGTREIFTFRVATSKSPSKWFHPGATPMRFLDDAYDWAKQQWDEKIAPEIMRGLF